MPPRIAPAVPIAPATFANDPGRCGIRTRIVMLYDADGWRARSPGDWSTIALSRIRSGSVRLKHRTRGRGWARPRPSRTMAPVHHAADRVAHAVLPLTLLAVAAAPVAPSATVAARSDVLLAALVALTALGIEPRRLEVLRRRPGRARAVGRPLRRRGPGRLGDRPALRRDDPRRPAGGRRRPDGGRGRRARRPRGRRRRPRPGRRGVVAGRERGGRAGGARGGR